MCGIVAIVSYRSDSPPVDRGELRRVRDHMQARGPDAAGEWISDDAMAAMGHRRLSIIDLSDAGTQPMIDADRGTVIVFNGEIYNYLELRRRLENRGYQFRSASDTEVLLHLYSERGREMVHELRGMYSFALWDPNRRGMLVARDPFGIKPLYVADNGKTVRIASQVKALLAGGAVDSSPDPAGHVGFFLWGHVPEPYTLHRGVRALPAGSTLWVDAAGAYAPRHYFEVATELRDAERRGEAMAVSDRAELLREAVLDSVRHHLVADVPVGVFLSSGIDSATLTALATEAGGQLQTVTLGFEEYRGAHEDEVPLAELVARRYSTRHNTVWVRAPSFRDHYDRIVDAMDQPTIDGLNSYFVSLAAAQSGLKVAISGLGGDELFGGYPSFRELPRAVRLLGWGNRVPLLGRGFRVVAASTLSRYTSPKYAGLLEYGGTYPGAYLLRRGLFMPWELPSVLDGDLVRQGWTELRSLTRLARTIDGIRSARLRVSALELSWYMRNQLLRDTDWASMAHSLEVRVPLVDVPLVRTVAALPGLESNGKALLANTPARALPRGVIERRKTGFVVPVRQWLAKQRGRGLRGWAQDIYDHFRAPAGN